MFLRLRCALLLNPLLYVSDTEIGTLLDISTIGALKLQKKGLYTKHSRSSPSHKRV